jgi:GNAT superfamily N-acetyltransferase
MSLTDVTIRYLELTSPGDLRAKRASREGVTFARVERPMPELNRFFYMAIGGEWFWLERRTWSLSQWSAYVSRPELETWVLSAGGVPAGYVELELRPSGDGEILYFGLLAAFVGGGLGAHLLTEAVERAWAMGASRVILNTCNLDHPRALANYLARGFREYRKEVKRKEVPDAPPGPWEGALASAR